MKPTKKPRHLPLGPTYAAHGAKSKRPLKAKDLPRRPTGKIVEKRHLPAHKSGPIDS